MSSYTTLIRADELQALRASGAPRVVVDASFDLADTAWGAREWRSAHLPGSIHLDLDRDLSGVKTGTNGRHPLPERAAFRALLGRIGVAPGVQVVALDRNGDVYAARVWWLLRWAGHCEVAVLDGGLRAWSEAGGEVVAADAGAATPASTAVPTQASAAGGDERAIPPVIDAERLAAGLGRLRVIDARAAERFRGDVEPLDAVAGHIPGALNRFWKDNLDASGRWKTSAQLRAEFEPLLGGQGPEAVVHQCGSGVTACHNLLAMEHAGLAGSMLYPGSWSEWSSDPQRPVARG
ncbi:sulfurtransferase [Piscinibacter koreensis]|uniref:Sulfurtransferase n=1 Tax=Piscinibacter koreensis TaxID=2742824 RepID=A0A7Y6TVU8_9BURK|nr:sulfurtransferase [Schlegelella koreensis]NUZ05405.1 sulfurtransferase [Schlegelella koreensis]